MSSRYIYKYKYKLVMLWVTISHSSELVFYQFSNQRMYNPEWYWCWCSPLWLLFWRCGFGSVHRCVSGVCVWSPTVVDWLQCRSPDEAGVYRILPWMRGFLSSWRGAGHPSYGGVCGWWCYGMRGSLECWSVYSGAVFNWCGFWHSVGDVQYLPKLPPIEYQLRGTRYCHP
jgi:hypothetical protein